MADQDNIADDEIILRRIPPEGIQERPEGGHRANSFLLRKRPGEDGSSCFRLCLMSPKDVLKLDMKEGNTREGWRICRIRVSDARALGFLVIPVHEEGKPGHCEIRHDDTLQIDLKKWNKRWSSLARTTRLLTPQEVNEINAGDLIIE